MPPPRVRIEHLRADIHGLRSIDRAALSGRLKQHAVVHKLDEIRQPEDPYLPAERAHLAKWLEAQATPLCPHVAVLDSIRSLAQPGTSCVLSCAKPALFTGPTNILWQALQTILLARRLTQRWETRVIPVLWNETDAKPTRALEEVRVLNRNYELQTVSLEVVSNGRKPLGEIPLDAGRHGMGALRAVLDQLYGDYEHTRDALDLFIPRAGETLARAFTRTLYDLLGKHGLVVIEADGLREEVAHGLARVVGSPFIERLRASMDLLPRSPDEGLIDLESSELVYHWTIAGVRTLHTGGDGYRYTDEPGSRTRSELAAEIVQAPKSWAPGALARPLVCSLVLPLAATVGDRDDLVRHVLVSEQYADLERSTPAFLPRVSMTIVDKDARHALERLDVSLAEVLSRHGDWHAANEETKKDAQLVQRLERIATETRAELSELKAQLVELDPNLLPVLKSSSREVAALFRKLSQRVQRVQANRGGKDQRLARCLNQGLCPLGQPQDQVLGPFSALARYGRGWIDDLLNEMDVFATEHVTLHLD